MGLISTQQYDRALRFVTQIARNIRTSPPVQIVRHLHARSFNEVQQVQAELERHYPIQPRRSHPPQTHRSKSPLPVPLPPSSRPLGQLPPYPDRQNQKTR